MKNLLLLLFVMLFLSDLLPFELYQPQDNVKTISDITVCKGLRNKECLETVHKAEELLPLELQEIIVETSDFIEVYVGNQSSFLHHMEGKRIHTTELPYAGITGYGYSKNGTVVYSMASEYVLMHELGHAYEYSFWYDGTQDNPSMSQEWQNAYESEFISAYGTTNVMEFYAECFAMYFRSPSTLRMLCPYAYSLLENDFGEME